MLEYSVKQISYSKLTITQYNEKFATLLGVVENNKLLINCYPKLSVSTKNILLRNNITTLGELSKISPNRLLKINNFGAKRLQEVYTFYGKQTTPEEVVNELAVNFMSDLTPFMEKEYVFKKVLELLTSHFESDDLKIPSIVIDEQICDGQARIANTKIAIAALLSLKNQGITDAQILSAFPTLNALDLTIAWLYSSTHKDKLLQEITNLST